MFPATPLCPAAITRPITRDMCSVAVALLVVTATVSGQGIRPQLGVGAGVTVPAGDYHATRSGEGFNAALQAMALVAFKVPTWPVGFRVDATYGTNAANDRLKDSLTARIGQPTDEKTKLLGANADVTYLFRPGSESRVQPYVLGGIGVYHITVSVTSGSSTADNAETRFAWNLGAGVGFRLQGTALFLEARYIDAGEVSGFPRTTFLPITAGIRFGGP